MTRGVARCGPATGPAGRPVRRARRSRARASDGPSRRPTTTQPRAAHAQRSSPMLLVPSPPASLAGWRFVSRSRRQCPPPESRRHRPGPMLPLRPADAPTKSPGGRSHLWLSTSLQPRRAMPCQVGRSAISQPPHWPPRCALTNSGNLVAASVHDGQKSVECVVTPRPAGSPILPKGGRDRRPCPRRTRVATRRRSVPSPRPEPLSGWSPVRCSIQYPETAPVGVASARSSSSRRPRLAPGRRPHGPAGR